MLKGLNGLPTNCEYCNSPLEWDGVHLVCNNENCAHKESAQIRAWCMNMAPVEGLGWKTIEKVINGPYYTHLKLAKNIDIDIKLMTTNLPLIPGVTFGHGEQGGFNKMLTILQHGEFKVSQFLLALNIPGLGKISAQNVENSPDCAELLDYIASNRLDFDAHDKLVALIQDKNVVHALENDYYSHFLMCYNLIKDRLIYTVTHDNKIEDKGEVVITGTLSVKRSDFESLLRQKGFKLVNTVNENTMYLITNTPDSETSKNKKADELGVVKITENDFRHKYNI